MKRFITTLVLTVIAVCGFAQTTSNSTSDKGGTGSVTLDGMFYYFTNTSPVTALGMNVGMGYRYYMHDNFFAEGLIGYRWTNSFSSSPLDLNTLEHDITLPIHVGAFLPVSDKFGIALLVGPRIEFPVAYKYELNNTKIDVGKPDVHTALELGCDFKFSDYGIRFIYGIGLGSENKANYIGLGMTTAF